MNILALIKAFAVKIKMVSVVKKYNKETTQIVEGMIVMDTIIVIIIILYICYKVGSRAEKKKQEEELFDDELLDDDIDDKDINNKYKYLSDDEILEIYSKVLNVPCRSLFHKRTGKSLTNEIINSPLQLEKSVGTLIMLEDNIIKIYVEKGYVCIAVGDDHFYGDRTDNVHNNYTCKIVEFEDTLEYLKPGDNITVVGILEREYSSAKWPTILKEAIVVKINNRLIPEVTDSLLDVENQ